MLVPSSAERHGAAGSTPAPAAAPRGRQMLVPGIPAVPGPTGGIQQKGMLVSGVSNPFFLEEEAGLPGALYSFPQQCPGDPRRRRCLPRSPHTPLSFRGDPRRC